MIGSCCLGQSSLPRSVPPRLEARKLGAELRRGSEASETHQHGLLLLLRALPAVVGPKSFAPLRLFCCLVKG